MKHRVIVPVLAALALGACNSKPASTADAVDAAETVETVETPQAATDSITAAVERLNEVFKSGKTSTPIDSITFEKGVLTFHCTSPAGSLDDAEGLKWLPSMALNDLPILGRGALQQIVDSDTSVRFEYVDKADADKKHSFALSNKDVAGKL